MSTKFAGLGMDLHVDDSGGTPVAIGADVDSVAVKTARGEQDVTGLDKFAHERLQLLEDSDVTITGGGFPSGTTRAVFEELDAVRTVTVDYPDSAHFAFEALFFDYNVSRANTGAITWTATGKTADGNLGAWS